MGKASGLALLAVLAALAALAARVPGQARAVVPRALLAQLGPSDTRASRVSQLAEDEAAVDEAGAHGAHGGRAGAGADDAAAQDSRGQSAAEPPGAEAKGSGGAPEAAAADFPAEADTGKLQDAWWYKEYMDKTVPNTQTLRWSSAFAPGPLVTQRLRR